MNKKSKYLLFVLLVFFVSCRKDKPEENAKPMAVVGSSGGVYITNEGNFQFGNARVSYYDIASTTITEDLYQTANKISLGDVCQSICFFNSKAYIVVNNSGKVEVVNPKTFVSSATIIGLSSPRYFLPVSNNKAYVSDLYANAISVVDLSNNSKTGSISCPGWTEEMVLSYGKAFVTNEYKDKVYIINTLNDILEDSIQVGYGSNSIKADKNGKIWVLCGGSITKGIKASLYKINPITKLVEQNFQFPNGTENPWRLHINGGNDTLYFLNGGVFRMPVIATTLPATAFVPQGRHAFYGIGIEPHSGILYISDAVDYVQRGVIYRYRNDGTLINSFLAGIVPGDFYFN